MHLECSEQQLLHLVLELLHGVGDRAVVLGEDGDRDDVAGDTASSSEVRLLRDIDVRHVLVFAQERQVEDDLQGLSVGSEDDQVSDTSVESLGGLVGALLEKFEVLGLSKQIKDGLGHGVVSLGVGAGQSSAVVLLVGSGLDNGHLSVGVGVLLLGLLLLLVFFILFVFLVLLIFLAAFELVLLLQRRISNQVDIILQILPCLTHTPEHLPF